jgi:hypothetical protein
MEKILAKPFCISSMEVGTSGPPNADVALSVAIRVFVDVMMDETIQAVSFLEFDPSRVCDFVYHPLR